MISLFCNHTPTIAFTHDILKGLNLSENDLLCITYRGNGWPGGFTAYLKDGSHKFITLREYWSNDLNNGPDCCKYCSDIGETADYLVGDPWNLGFEGKDSLGLSLVICRNRKTTQWVGLAAKEGYLEISKCTRRQLIQSQGYHIVDKLNRGAMNKDVRQTAYHRGMVPRVIERGKCTIRKFVWLARLLTTKDRYSFLHVACRITMFKPILRRYFKNRVLIWYWRDERAFINLGDYISEILVRMFGYRAINYSNASVLGLLPTFKYCLMIIGSELHKEKVDELTVPELYVWGQGKGHGKSLDLEIKPYSDKVEIFAVRGPYTRQHLGLDMKLPLGDPGLLLPFFFIIRRRPSLAHISYVPHWTNRSGMNSKSVAIGAEKTIDILCRRSRFWSTCRAIVSSRFVLTNSLHAAVLCHAYGTPWALCLADGDELNFPDKWRDFYELIGIAELPCAVRNYQEGSQWWEQFGSHARTVDLLPLLSAFPLPIRNRQVLSLMEKMKAPHTPGNPSKMTPAVLDQPTPLSPIGTRPTSGCKSQ